MNVVTRLSSLARPHVARGAAVAVALWTISASLSLTGCMSRSLTSLAIEPAANLTCTYPGGTVQFRAYGTYTESGHAAVTRDITDQATWSSTLPVASINASGLATASGLVIGTTDIDASANGQFGIVRGTSTLKVSTTCVPAAVRKFSSLAIVPAAWTLTNAGETEQPLAIASGPAGPLDLSRQVTWQSSNPAVATVDNNGVVRAVAPGKAVITARQAIPGAQPLIATQTVVFSAPSPDQ